MHQFDTGRCNRHSTVFRMDTAAVQTVLVWFQPMQLTLRPFVNEHWYAQRRSRCGPTSVTTISALRCC